MDWLVEILIFLAIGAVAGWFAGIIMKSKKNSLVLNIVLGVVGAVVGGFLAGLIGLSGGLLVQIAIAVGGACLLILLYRLVTKK